MTTAASTSRAAPASCAAPATPTGPAAGAGEALGKVLYFDLFSGVSGDMLLGALVDAGVAPEVIIGAVGALGIGGYSIRFEECRKGALRATRAVVETGGGHAHDHGDGHDHVHQPSRRLHDVLQIIGASRLGGEVKDLACAVFRRLADAEAAVHGTFPEEVHFHEVGAVDALVDIVGASAGVVALGASHFLTSPFPVNPGTVRTDHGQVPLPAPATLELIKGYAVRPAPTERELVTPTGAALVTVLCAPNAPKAAAAADAGGGSRWRQPGAWPNMVVRAIGYGAGTLELPWPNVVRLVVGERGGADVAGGAGGEQAAAAGPHPAGLPPGLIGGDILVAEVNLDDMNPQLFGPLFARLLEAGAVDVGVQPMYMKKGRPGNLLTVLMPPERATAVIPMILAETTSLGVRTHLAQRWMLQRELVEVATAYGPVRIKVGRAADGTLFNAAPEYEDVLKLAIAKGVPVKEVQQAAQAAGRRALGLPE